MIDGARTPEELGTLLEDAFLIRDGPALAELFEDGAVLREAEREARGHEAIVRLVTDLWDGDGTYLAEPCRIVQARDTALVLSSHGVSVMRRGRHGAWRYAIALLAADPDDGGTTVTAKPDAQTLEPLAVRRGEGEARWWFGALAEIKATAADTGGRMTIVEVTEPPGSEAPLHVHHRDDEAFWILDGDVTFEVGDTIIEAGVGDYVFGPRGIPHRFTVGDAGCRMLFILVPGGFEDLIRTTSEPAASRTLPPPSEEEPDIDRLKPLVAAHGYGLLV